jgi:hypothetical protein
LRHDALGPCGLFLFFVYFHRLTEAGKQPPPLILIYYDLTLEAVLHARLRKLKTTASLKFYVAVNQSKNSAIHLSHE